MSTEKWIVLCALFSAATFFAGAHYGEATSRPIVDSRGEQIRELEMLVDTMERRESVLIAELGRTPDLPAKPITPGGKVIRE